MNLQDFLAQEDKVTSQASDAAAAKKGFVAPLNDLGLIQVSGGDAASYLHNQLSNDVEHLPLGEARLAAYCSPKGRMLASFLMWKTEDGIFLQLSSSIQAGIQKRLQMFVMRAKAKLIDATPAYRMLGLGGAAAGQVLQQWFPELPAQLHGKVETASGSLIRVADALSHARYLWICKNEVLEQSWPVLQQQLVPVHAQLWRRCEILAGIPRITDKNQEQFVPQMVNFELIGGVNFRKGCYPGQEIVARSQYLGKLKRRMAIATVSGNTAQAGMEVFAAGDELQPCGMIVNAEADSADSSICLVELKVADREAGHVHLGSVGGAQLKFLPLPYATLDVTL